MRPPSTSVSTCWGDRSGSTAVSRSVPSRRRRGRQVLSLHMASEAWSASGPHDSSALVATVYQSRATEDALAKGGRVPNDESSPVS